MKFGKLIRLKANFDEAFAVSAITVLIVIAIENASNLRRSTAFRSDGLILTFKWNSLNLSKVFWPVITSWASVTSIKCTFHEHRLQSEFFSADFFSLSVNQIFFLPLSVLDQFHFILWQRLSIRNSILWVSIRKVYFW